MPAKAAGLKPRRFVSAQIFPHGPKSHSVKPKIEKRYLRQPQHLYRPLAICPLRIVALFPTSRVAWCGFRGTGALWNRRRWRSHSAPRWGWCWLRCQRTGAVVGADSRSSIQQWTRRGRGRPLAFATSDVCWRSRCAKWDAGAWTRGWAGATRPLKARWRRTSIVRGDVYVCVKRAKLHSAVGNAACWTRRHPRRPRSSSNRSQ